MIPEIGHFALTLALLLACVQVVLPLWGAARGRVAWMALGRPAAVGQALFVLVAFACLMWSFYANDFSVRYVVQHSNTALPWAYRLAAVWGGHEGSILLWLQILSGWTWAVAIYSHHLEPGMLARILGIMGLISIGFLLLSLVCIYALLRWERRATAHAPNASAADRESAIRGGILEGATRVARSPYLLAICLFVLFYTSLSTFLYFEQAHIVRDAFDDSAKRTAVFAAIDLAVNTLTVLAQLFVTSRLIRYLGLGTTLALVPLGLAVGFLVLAVHPVLAVLVGVQILRRAGNYAFTRPGREVLFTVLPRTDKYKSKNFIDTVVYRGGDALSAWAFAGLTGLGLGLSAIAWLAVPLALLWAGLGVWLGRRQEALRDTMPNDFPPAAAMQRE